MRKASFKEFELFILYFQPNKQRLKKSDKFVAILSSFLICDLVKNKTHNKNEVRWKFPKSSTIVCA